MTVVSPIEFGRVVGYLEAMRSEIKELKDRAIWRLDNLEGRVESLEKSSADQGFARRFVDKLVWAIVGAGLLGITAGAVQL